MTKAEQKMKEIREEVHEFRLTIPVDQIKSSASDLLLIKAMEFSFTKAFELLEELEAKIDKLAQQR